MKRFMIVFCLIGLMVSGCSGQASSPKMGEVTAEDFQITLNERKLNLNAVFSTGYYGESLSYYEAESCGFAGLDKIYTYTDYEIYTYPVNAKDQVLEIKFLENTKTSKKIGVGSTLADVKKVYGEKGVETGNLLEYTFDHSVLSMLLDNGRVSELSFVYLP